jgi:hypothetical protein
MAVYAHDILTGNMPGPYSDSGADHFARLATNAGRRDVIAALPSSADRLHRADRRRRRRFAPASVSALASRRARSGRCR